LPIFVLPRLGIALGTFFFYRRAFERNVSEEAQSPDHHHIQCVLVVYLEANNLGLMPRASTHHSLWMVLQTELEYYPVPPPTTLPEFGRVAVVPSAALVGNP
jgi:hypothetical protein